MDCSTDCNPDCNALLLQAAAHGQPSEICALLESKADVNHVGDNDLTPLWLAVHHGRVATARVLLDHKADVHSADVHSADVHSADVQSQSIIGNELKRSKSTGIVEAAQVLPVFYCRFVIAGTNCNALLLQAAAHGQLSEIRALLASKANINHVGDSDRTPLWKAVQHGQVATARVLLDMKADVKGHKAKYPLVSAAKKGNVDAALVLLDHKALLNRRDKYGYGLTPVALAARAGHLSAVTFFLERGAKVDVKDCNEKTALLHACARGHADVAQRLIHHKARVCHKALYGKTPLLEAVTAFRTKKVCEERQIAVVQVLVDCKANINCADAYKTTAVRHAVDDNHCVLLAYLLARRAEADIRDSYGQTPLCCARSARAAQLLLDHKAFIDYMDNVGRTPLALAIRTNCLDVVSCLLARGADVEIEDDDGRAAIAVARTRGNEDAMHLLLDHCMSSRGPYHMGMICRASTL
jgi:ankyrin repeat protein